VPANGISSARLAEVATTARILGMAGFSWVAGTPPTVTPATILVKK
jgi:hypothetical protein